MQGSTEADTKTEGPTDKVRAISPDSTFQVAQGVLGEAVEDEVILLDSKNGLYFELNNTGALIWSGLADGQPLKAIHTNIMDKFAVDEESARRDLNGLVSELESAKLIERTSEKAPGDRATDV